jgi:hypothetical protein
MHHIANGHNDILMGFFIALGCYLAIIGAGFWIIPALVTAALLKYAAVLLIPPAFVFVGRTKGWRAAIASTLLGIAFAAVVSKPYLADWQQFKLTDIQDNATLLDNSLHSLLIHIFENFARLLPKLALLHAVVDTVIKDSLRAGFLVFLIIQWMKIPPRFTPRVFSAKSLLILFVLVCVVSSKFNGWYMGMMLPLALLLEEDYWLRRLVLLISCTELLSLTFFKQAYMLNYFAMILVPAWIIFRQERSRRFSVRSAKLDASLAVEPG